jgi:hypothetical protein
MDLFPEIFAAKRLERINGFSRSLVAAEIAKIPYGGIGTYVTALWTPANNGDILNPGDTVAGSALRRGNFGSGLNSTNNTFYGALSGNTTTLSLIGTWRALTYVNGFSNANGYLTLFVRIA